MSSTFSSPPHFDDPLAAPRPHRVDPGLSQNIARDLDRLNPAMNRPPSTLSSDWSPWNLPGNGPPAARTPSPLPPARLPSPPRDGSLTLPLPSLPALTAALQTVTSPSHDPTLQLAWARDVLFLVDRTPALSTSPLALAAAPLILKLADAKIPEAIYLRATFAAAGTYPNLLLANPRAAFRDFEAAARAGHAPAWFRLARDYEAFNDAPHAIDCLNRGAKARDPAALHRLGTAHLLGQLNLDVNPTTALPYLHQAATRATLQCPQPAYVFALILLGEFTTPVAAPLLQPFLPPGQSKEAYARALLERAAALHFAPAQYKLGHAFEFAVPASAFPFDPLLSVQWYSLASQAGEAEADMALSKWFLCGAEGAFDKDESLARTFAGKAAAKGLASGEFAMGYYSEVGIGGSLDLTEARSWYEKASAHGNADAVERLKALAQSVPQALSRTEHDALTGDKLVRKRTQARMRSDREGGGGGGSDFADEPGSYVNPHPDPYGANPMDPYGVRRADPYGVGAAGVSASPPRIGGGAPPMGAGGRATAPPSSYRGGGPGGQQERRTRVMELARKSSMAESDPQGHYRTQSAGGFDYRMGAPQPRGGAPPQQQRGGAPPQQMQRPPREGSMTGVGPRPGGGGGGRGGYALSDTGSRPGSVAGSVG
ncbi:hypothetical protein R3P38DRAFT_2689045, partial [Favolaschia claudopus]